jgi:hypothetical protein
MMIAWYDTEFHERGHHFPIDLISIGLVRQDGFQYYAICSEFDFEAAWNNPGKDGDYWLRENVLKQLPLIWPENRSTPKLDKAHASVRSRAAIRRELMVFLGLDGLNPAEIELWAWYADYDHVVLCQLFGTMAELPAGMPMFTHDLKQELALHGNPPMPAQVRGHHNALDDALHLKYMWSHAKARGLVNKTTPIN